MGRSSQLVFSDQQAFIAVSKDWAHYFTNILCQRISRSRKNRPLCFKTALFIRRARCGYGANARESRRLGEPARMDFAEENRVCAVCADSRWSEIQSRDTDDVCMAEARPRSNLGQ